MEVLAETKPHSASTTQASAPIVPAPMVMAIPNTGREVHLSHGFEKGIGGSGQNDNSQFDLLPCLTELSNKTVDGTLVTQQTP